MSSDKEVEFIIGTDLRRFEAWLDNYRLRTLPINIYLEEGKHLSIYRTQAHIREIKGYRTHKITGTIVSVPPHNPNVEILSNSFPVIVIILFEHSKNRLNVMAQLSHERMGNYYKRLLQEIARLWPEAHHTIMSHLETIIENQKPRAPDIMPGKRGAGFYGSPPPVEKTWSYIFPIKFVLLATAKEFWSWFNDNYPKFKGWQRTPINDGGYKISNSFTNAFESVIKIVDNDRRILVEGMHYSQQEGRWHEELQEQAELYFGEFESGKTKTEVENFQIEEGLEEYMPTMKQVVTAVGESLDVLDKSVYKIETNEVGANFQFTVYKLDAYIGTYRIKPGEPGGSIQFTEDEELSKEWIRNVFDLVHGKLQRKFGKFPWVEQPRDNEVEDTGHFSPLKAEVEKSSTDGEMKISKRNQGTKKGKRQKAPRGGAVERVALACLFMERGEIAL